MGRARDTLGQTGTHFASAERTVALFAARGLGSIIPAAQGAEFAISRLLQRALTARGTLLLLGQAGALIAGTFVVAAGVQRLQEEIRNWLALGETVSQTTERIKKDAEEQKAFAADR